MSNGLNISCFSCERKMGLISTKVEIKWEYKTREHYKNIGYTFTNWKDKFIVGVDDLMNGSGIKVKCKCDNCEKEYEMRWVDYNKGIRDDGKIYCLPCAIKLYGHENSRITQLKNSTTFKQWCLNNNLQEILNLWDDDLNKNSPNEVSYGSEIKYWFKCPNGIHESELKSIQDFTSGHDGSIKCKACNSMGQWLINKYGDDALDIYWSSKNTINPFEISYGSKTNIWIKCHVCKNEKMLSSSTFTRQGLSCPKCSDGIPFGEKFIFEMFEQLKEEFKTQMSFDWAKDKKYDDYLFVKEIILEVHGMQHYEEQTGNWKMNLKEVQENDKIKKELALINGILEEKYIEIDARYSTLEYMKKSIENNKKLNKLFDLSNIDWLKCYEFACKSLVKTACDLWSNGMENVVEIGKQLKISRSTMGRYLNQGYALGWCDYNSEEESKKNTIKQSIKIYCVDLDKVFNSTMEVERELGIYHNLISKCCLGKSKSAGKHPITGEKLHWMYYEDYLKLHSNEDIKQAV